MSIRVLGVLGGGIPSAVARLGCFGITAEHERFHLFGEVRVQRAGGGIQLRSPRLKTGPNKVPYMDWRCYP